MGPSLTSRHLLEPIFTKFYDSKNVSHQMILCTCYPFHCVCGSSPLRPWMASASRFDTAGNERIDISELRIAMSEKVPTRHATPKRRKVLALIHYQIARSFSVVPIRLVWLG